MLFGKRVTPAERLRQHQRTLTKAQRELDRERVKLEGQVNQTERMDIVEFYWRRLMSKDGFLWETGEEANGRYQEEREERSNGQHSSAPLLYLALLTHNSYPLLDLIERRQNPSQRPRPHSSLHSEIHADASPATGGFVADAGVEK